MLSSTCGLYSHGHIIFYVVTHSMIMLKLPFTLSVADETSKSSYSVLSHSWLGMTSLRQANI